MIIQYCQESWFIGGPIPSTYVEPSCEYRQTDLNQYVQNAILSRTTQLATDVGAGNDRAYAPDVQRPGQRGRSIGSNTIDMKYEFEGVVGMCGKNSTDSQQHLLVIDAWSFGT